MAAIIADTTLAIIVMLLVFLPMLVKTKGQLTGYMIVPVLLIWVHVIGNGMQETDNGPEWAQNHLHDLGVATFALMQMQIYFGLRHRMSLYSPGYDADLPMMVMRFVIGSHLVGTLMCIGYKISQVTVFHEDTLAKGYSGQLDFGDISMFVLGFLIIVANHFALRGQVLRKRNAYLHLLEQSASSFTEPARPPIPAP